MFFVLFCFVLTFLMLWEASGKNIKYNHPSAYFMQYPVCLQKKVSLLEFDLFKNKE